MALERFVIRGGDDWLLFAARVDAPDDDLVYVVSTECWPVWLDVERRFGLGASSDERGSLHNPAVLAMVAAAADDRDFAHRPTWLRCDVCRQWPRYADRDGIRSICGCAVDGYGNPLGGSSGMAAAGAP